MDIAICTVSPATSSLLYAGVKRPLDVFKNGGLESIQPLNVLEQYTTLNNTIEKWKSYDPENFSKTLLNVKSR